VAGIFHPGNGGPRRPGCGCKSGIVVGERRVSSGQILRASTLPPRIELPIFLAETVILAGELAFIFTIPLDPASGTPFLWRVLWSLFRALGVERSLRRYYASS
jgi:hypothetical protein